MSRYVGTPRLIWFTLRRDRVRIPVWILGIALTVLGSVASFKSSYPTAADRQVRAAVVDNAVVKLFTGPGFGLSDYTFGAMTANELLPMTALVVALMNIFLVVRHTRAEEESERAELLRATAVGRLAPTTAALCVVVAADLALGALLTLGLPPSLDELSTKGSLAFAAAVVGVGLVFGAVALVAAQVAMSARGALGVASMALGAWYLLAAFGNVTGIRALSWLSPFGWAAEMRAYVDERWWPLALTLTATIALLALAARIGSHRDLGAGLMAGRPGPPNAAPWLDGPFGLAFRLQRSSVLWWSVSLAFLGAVYGSITEQAGKLYRDIGSLERYSAHIGASSAIDEYRALTLYIAVLVAGGFAVQATLRPRSEESAGRADPVISTAVSRFRWAGGHVAIALGGGAVALFVIGLGMGAADAISTGDAGQLPRTIGAALTYTPALWVLSGFAFALFGLVPRATSAAWLVLAGVAFVGFFGPLLHIPHWVYDLSPVEHVPRLPVASFSLAPLAVLLLIAIALFGAGFGGLRRRDLVSA
jgi:ABC-2 type transport system permease protein